VLADSSHGRENSLLVQLAQGDENAFRQIYDRYWHSIYKVARRYTRSATLAEDIVQEVFSALWDRRAEFTAVIHLEAYLVTMTRNLTYKTMRRLAFEEVQKSKFLSDQEVADNTFDDVLLEKQYEQLVEQAVSRLPSQQKTIFHMARVEGLSHDDIARQLNISRLTVKSHMAKALQSIRHYLQPHLNPFEGSGTLKG
jgi:RNA polymerase sigma-70 factor (family 1)